MHHPYPPPRDDKIDVSEIMRTAINPYENCLAGAYRTLEPVWELSTRSSTAYEIAPL